MAESPALGSWGAWGDGLELGPVETVGVEQDADALVLAVGHAENPRLTRLARPFIVIWSLGGP